MATEKEKLLKVKEVKTSIKDVINANGGNVGEVFSEYPLAIENLLTGGGGSDSPKGQYRIRYIDVDGTVLKEEWLDSGATLTPPKAPNYDPDYLVFDTWNYDVEKTVVNSPLDIEAIYNTIDGSTYLFCRFTTNTGLNPTLALTNGTPTIDWGDGTIDTNLTHTYASDGKYIIKISGSFTFNTNSGTYLLGSSSLNYALQKIYLGNVTSIGEYAFRYCSIKRIVMSNDITDIGYSAFRNCNLLQSIVIPSSVTNINMHSFNTCYSLQSVSIPSSVTNIGGSAFSNCYSLTNYFILCDQVPTLSDTNAFNNINKGCVMWVNDEIYKELQTATNWSTYASYMKKLSEYEGDYYD